MPDELSAVPPPNSPETGSLGPQVAMTPSEASGLIRIAPPNLRGLTAVTTAEQLAELARSDDPPEVKRDIVVGMLLGAHQATEADLRFRLESGEKELIKLRRQIAEANAQIGSLRGDARVCQERIAHLVSHRNWDVFLTFVSSILFGLGGAFIGRSWPAVGIGFVTGLLLFIYSWFHTPSKPESGK